VGINPSDYMEFSSYKDSPYYERIVLPVSDNWSYDWLYNVPMGRIDRHHDNALAKGYIVVGEPTFLSRTLAGKWRSTVPNLDLNNITPEQKKTLFERPTQEK
jgi:bleomycin hydrolase